MNLRMSLRESHYVPFDNRENPIGDQQYEFRRTFPASAADEYLAAKRSCGKKLLIPKRHMLSHIPSRWKLYTHATAVPPRLVVTANFFYTYSKGNWICLQLSRKALTDIGIITKDEEALPVGDAGVPSQIRENMWVVLIFMEEYPPLLRVCWSRPIRWRGMRMGPFSISRG